MDILQESTNDTIKLSFGEWKGTKPGCYCANNDTIVLNKCPENQTNCTENIAKVGGETIYTWRNRTFYTTLSKYTYNELLLMSVDENQECPFGRKKCGKLDFFNNTLCIPEDENCPVNYLEITQNAEPPTNKYKFTSIPLDGGYYIHYSNEATDNYTIKNFFRSGDVLPCITLSDYNNSLPSYKLNDGSCYYRHNGIYASAYYYKVDSISMEQLLK